MVTTAISSILGSTRSASNGRPLLVVVIFSGLILTRESVDVQCGNASILLTTESIRGEKVLVHHERRSIVVDDNHQFALNASDDSAVASNSTSRTAVVCFLLDLVSNFQEVSGVIVVDADLQFTHLSVISKDLTSDISGVGVTSTRTSNEEVTSLETTFQTVT